MKKLKRTTFVFSALIALLMLSACTSDSDAKRALNGAGYTDISIGGYDWLGCSKDDFFHTEFTAKNPAGNMVSGTVCSGLLFKNATIRH